MILEALSEFGSFYWFVGDVEGPCQLCEADSAFPLLTDAAKADGKIPVTTCDAQVARSDLYEKLTPLLRDVLDI